MTQSPPIPPALINKHTSLYATARATQDNSPSDEQERVGEVLPEYHTGESDAPSQRDGSEDSDSMSSAEESPATDITAHRTSHDHASRTDCFSFSQAFPMDMLTVTTPLSREACLLTLPQDCS